jgi:hypothetical protein
MAKRICAGESGARHSSKINSISLVVEKRLESTNKKKVLCIGCLIMEERVFFRGHAGAFSQREKDRGKVWHHRNKYGNK